MSNLTSSDIKGNAFTREEAVKLIIALVENKVIGLPFTNCFDAEHVAMHIQRFVNHAPSSVIEEPELILRKADAYAVANLLKGLTRKDAFFYLSLLEALTNGLTEDERRQMAYWESR